MTHRASYWMTTSLSFLSAAVSVAVPMWLPRSVLPWITVLIIYSLMAVDFMASLLVASGGLVCLWRDGRDEAGKPDLFALFANRVPRKTSLLARLGRMLQGPALCPGDIVRVKSLQEIQATLGPDGMIEGLPFMEEMQALCGKTFRVHRRVDKINDMRNKTGLRRMNATVTLSEVRCNGASHGGCQAECQILWKDQWLTRVADDSPLSTLRDKGMRACGPMTFGLHDPDRIYMCQMTQLWEASRPMSSSDIRQDLRAVLCGNLPVRAFALALLTRLFNRVQRLRGGAGYPFLGTFGASGSTPSVNLHLDATDMVRVRNSTEIAQTLVKGRNKGLWFDPEMARYCGRPATVRRRVERVIHEATGKMVVMKTPCVVLEEGIATGEFLRFCPQHEYIFWREVWLQKDKDKAAIEETRGAECRCAQ
jgi:hypothetical protein